MSLPKCILLATHLAPRTDRAQDRTVGLAGEWSAKLTFVCAIDVAEVPSDEAKRLPPRSHGAELSRTPDPAEH